MKTSNVSRDHPRAIVDGWVDPVALPPGDGGSGIGGGSTQTQNNSGGDFLAGDVVVLANDGTLVATTTAGDTRPVGVALDDIAWGAFGPVAWSGPVPRINLDSAATAGHYAETSTTAGEGTDVGASPTAASFGYFTGSGTNPSGFLIRGSGTGGSSAPPDTYEAFLTAAVTMVNANTWYDGPTLSLPAGSYLVHVQAEISAASALGTYESIGIYDGSALVVARGGYNPPGNAGGVAHLAAFARITLAGTTTVKLQCASVRGTSDSVILDTGLVNGVTDKCTSIVAVTITSA